jgi:hypothetical protein
MSFIKHGDGKIVDIIKAEDLTEEQRKTAEIEANKIVKQSETDTSDVKKSGSK